MIKNIITNKEYETLEDALSEVGVEESLLVLSDLIIDKKIEISKSFDTFDLNGKTMIIKSECGLDIKKNSVFFIKNGNILCENDTLISISKDSYVSIIDTTISCKQSSINVNSGGRLYIKNSDISSTGEDATITVSGKGSYICIYENSKITSEHCNCITVKNNSTIDNYGTIETINGTCLNVNNASAILHEHSVLTSKNSSALSISSGGSCSIDSGEILSYSETEPCIVLQNSNSMLNITGGNITSKEQIGILCTQVKDGYSNYLIIDNCNIKSKLSSVSSNGGGQYVIEIKGGRFSSELDESYISDGYYSVFDYPNKEFVVLSDNEKLSDYDEIKNESVCLNDIEPKSYNIVKQISVYRTPSRNRILTTILGPIRVVTTNHINPSTKEEFVLVKFKISGVGGYDEGYVSKYDLLGGIV